MEKIENSQIDQHIISILRGSNRTCFQTHLLMRKLQEIGIDITMPRLRSAMRRVIKLTGGDCNTLPFKIAKTGAYHYTKTETGTGAWDPTKVRLV